MIRLRKIKINVSGTELEINENLQSVLLNNERIGVISYACTDKNNTITNGIELFKLPEQGELKEEFLKKGWKEKGWSKYMKKLTPEQNEQIKAEWKRIYEEFDKIFLSGKIKMELSLPKEQTEIYFDIENPFLSENLSDFNLSQFIWGFKYKYEQKYKLTGWCNFTKEMQQELIEKREINITEWALSHIKKQDEEERKEKERFQAVMEEEKREIEKAMEEEIMVYGNEILSCNTNLLIHSLAFHCTGDRINLYTTVYAREIPKAKTSYDIKEVLKKEGFKFEKDTKYWYLEETEENINKAIEILKKYDTKADPNKLGLMRCWECGCYRRYLDSSGYCGC